MKSSPNNFINRLKNKKIMVIPTTNTIAAALYGKLNLQGKNIVTLISGGNVDIEHAHPFVVDTTTFS